MRQRRSWSFISSYDTLLSSSRDWQISGFFYFFIPPLTFIPSFPHFFFSTAILPTIDLLPPTRFCMLSSMLLLRFFSFIFFALSSIGGLRSSGPLPLPAD